MRLILYYLLNFFVHFGKTYVLVSNGNEKWSKQTLNYYFPEKLDDKVNSNRSEFAKELKEAFDLWSNVSNLNFNEIESDSDADIKVSFESRSHGDWFGNCSTCQFSFDGPGMVVAHSFPPEHLLKGKLHFDADETWNTDYRKGITKLG